MCRLRWCEPADGLIQNTQNRLLVWIELSLRRFSMSCFYRVGFLFFCCIHIQQRVGVLNSRLDFVLITSTELLIEGEDFGIFSVLYAYVSHCFPNAICRRFRLTQYFFYTFVSWRRIKSRSLSAAKCDEAVGNLLCCQRGKITHIFCALTNNVSDCAVSVFRLCRFAPLSSRLFRSEKMSLPSPPPHSLTAHAHQIKLWIFVLLYCVCRICLFCVVWARRGKRKSLRKLFFKVNSNAGDDESIVAVGSWQKGNFGEGDIFHFSIIELILSVCLRLCGICWSIYACEWRADTQNQLSLHVFHVKMFSISRNSICYDNFAFVWLQKRLASYLLPLSVSRPFFRQLPVSSVWK